MKFTLKKRTFGSRINAALRYFLRLVIYMIVGGAFLMIPIFFYFLIKTNQELELSLKTEVGLFLRAFMQDHLNCMLISLLKKKI